MMSAGQYRDHAENASRMAERTADVETAAAFGRVAREWMGLADMADAHLRLLRNLAEGR